MKYIAVTLALCASAAACADPGVTADPAQALAAVAEDVWQRQLEVDLRARAREGLPLERLPIPTLERAQADADFSRAVLDRLDAIDPDALDADDRITWEVLRRGAEMTIEGLDHYWVITNVLTPYSSPIGALRQLFGMVPVADDAGREVYLTLLAPGARCGRIRRVPRARPDGAGHHRARAQHGCRGGDCSCEYRPVFHRPLRGGGSAPRGSGRGSRRG